MTDREAMKMALDALDSCEFDYDNNERQVRTFDALLVNAAHRALHEALAQPDETETLKRCLFQMQEAAKALAQDEPPFELTDAGADTNISRGLEPKGSGMVTLHQPVAWMMPDYGDVLSASEADGTGIYNIPLYTAPPKREWVGLTQEEVQEIAKQLIDDAAYCSTHFAIAIEAELRRKNSAV
jgi:hypothetical protein